MFRATNARRAVGESPMLFRRFDTTTTSGVRLTSRLAPLSRNSGLTHAPSRGEEAAARPSRLFPAPAGRSQLNTVI